MTDAPVAQNQRLVLPSRLSARSAARRTWLLVLGAVAIAAGAITYYRWPRSAGAAVYRTAPLERRTITRVIEATGQVDVESRIEIAPSASGAVVELLATQGASVKAGQPLATLNPNAANAAAREATAGLGAAASRVAAAETDLEIAIERRKRVEELFNDHFVKRADVDTARVAEERARSALQTAKAERDVTVQKVNSAKEAQKFLTVRAPVDGIVLVAPAAVGVAAGPDKGPLFVLTSSLKVMHINALVAEADIGAVAPGQKAKFTVPAFPGLAFEGAVDRIGIEPDPDSTVVAYPVTFSVQNPELKLRPGMSADVRIFVAEARDVLSVREGALRFSPDAEGTGNRTRLWISRDGRDAEAVDVTPGLSDGAYTQITPKETQKLEVGEPAVVGFLRPEKIVDSKPGISLGKK
ncbi:MAG TPA: efflux RND transporter periplasmic adaptor subunit [Polyangiaceae bacterium]|nr:efflux RND transporter periplasmic adaptor subunit [Polyangiaceae bacterium]